MHGVFQIIQIRKIRTMEKKKVVVGMSGGVDSSVAAYLLKEQGYDVIGVTMQIWQDEDESTMSENGGCCGLSAVDDARRVAMQLGIPYYVMNFKKEFKENVIDYFVKDYLDGKTPNPCIACNRYVKWQSLLERSLGIGADFIATGHYAKVVHLENGRYALKVSKTAAKDQTYALYNLTQDQLKRTLMPVGDYTKEEIRALAENISLRIAHKPDSQEICFIPDHDHAGFIEKEVGKKFEEGNFVFVDGRILGRHQGIAKYTVGQRKGLGISLGYPIFVKEIKPETNEVIIGEAKDILSRELVASDLNWQAIEGLQKGESIRAKAKIRYSHQGEECEIFYLDTDRVKVVFEKEVRAITPGQAVVFYNEEQLVLGGGTIER